MSISSMAGVTLDVYRRTNYVLEIQPSSPLMTLTRALSSASILQITTTATLDSVITVNGSYAGNPITETVSFPASPQPQVQRTIQLFDEVTTLFVDATIVDSDIDVRSIGQDGSTVYSNYVIAEGVRAHLNHGVAYWKNLDAGASELQEVWFGIDYTTLWSPREGDVFVLTSDSSQWLVTGTPNYQGNLRPHHWEIRAKRRSGSL